MAARGDNNAAASKHLQTDLDMIFSLMNADPRRHNQWSNESYFCYLDGVHA
jgi:hypothetical protein